MLGCARGERIGGSKNLGHSLMGGQSTTSLNALDQSVLAPFLVVDIHRLRDTIGEKNYLISSPEPEGFLLIAVPQQSDYRTTSLQPHNLACGDRMPEDNGGVVTSVDVGKLQSSRIVFGVEQRRITVRGGSLTYEPVDLLYQID